MIPWHLRGRLKRKDSKILTAEEVERGVKASYLNDDFADPNAWIVRNDPLYDSYRESFIAGLEAMGFRIKKANLPHPTPERQPK